MNESFRNDVLYYLENKLLINSIAIRYNENKNNIYSKQFTKAGPGKYIGNILDSPDLVWTDDLWDENRIQDAHSRLEKQGNKSIVSSFWRCKYENEASTYWHEFYKRNTTNFYKDRHYLHIVFPDLLNAEKSLLEVGCGVGNAVIPLLEINPKLKIYAFDCAKSAIELFGQNVLYENNKNRMNLYVCDIVKDNSSPVDHNSMDYILCMFVLSAISPLEHIQVFNKLKNSLKIGGRIFLRDYGLYDEAQLRFKKNSKLDDNFYVRDDGTCSYFFCENDIKMICNQCDLKVIEFKYINRQYANRGQKVARYRVWIHAILEKQS